MSCLLYYHNTHRSPSAGRYVSGSISEVGLLRWIAWIYEPQTPLWRGGAMSISKSFFLCFRLSHRNCWKAADSWSRRCSSYAPAETQVLCRQLWVYAVPSRRVQYRLVSTCHRVEGVVRWEEPVPRYPRACSRRRVDSHRPRDCCNPFNMFSVVECTRGMDDQPLRFNSLAERVMNEISYVADVPRCYA